jgi:uncharacterized protein YjeT (DUF2065 family)
MSASRYIAGLLGPLLLVMGFGMVIESETMMKLSQEFLSNLSLIYLAGILTLLAGLAIVNAHNVWVADWRVIITIFGWLAILGGLFRILLPSEVRNLGTGFASNPNAMIVAGIVMLVLGAILSWVAYEHLWRVEEKPAPAAKPARKRAAPAKKAAKRKTSARKTAKRAPRKAARRPARKRR